MSDATDPTAPGRAVTPRLDSNGTPISTQAATTRRELADDWVLYMCFIIGLAAVIAFVGAGYAFPGDVVGEPSQFNAVAGTIGAIGAVLGLLPFLGIFAVLRVKDA